MSSLRKDILFTLSLKLSLLFMLWFICFRHNTHVESMQKHYFQEEIKYAANRIGS